MSDADQREARTEARITVRQVTDVQVSWTETEREAPGAFTIQLVLDRGAEEYVLRPTSGDAEVLVRLLESAGTVMFDTDRKVLIFPAVALPS